MVKMMNSEFGRMKQEMIGVCLLLCVSYFMLPTSAFSQQPQAAAGTPLYSANAKYVNGVAPGYWPTAGSGLTLNLSAGTAYCGNPPSLVDYPGGTLTMTASTTNYVYLDPANNCAPSVTTSTFAAGQIPIAKVVAGTSSITTITDARTWFTPQPCSTSSSGAVDCSATGTDQGIALTPSGTGNTVVTNLVDKGGQVFNVKAYGAVGDGKTNDSAAIQAAYNAAKAVKGTVYFPVTKSCYLIDSPINMTSDPTVAVGVTLEGESETGASICANTGGVAFDVSGSDTLTFKDLNITTTGMSDPSTIGLLGARNSGNSGPSLIVMENCQIIMPVHTSGTAYSFAAYLYGSELDYFANDQFTADYPLVVTANNVFNVSSPFITIGKGGQSETQDTFIAMELDCSGLGPAAYFNSTSNMTLTGHSWNYNQSSNYSSSLYEYAIEMVNDNTAMFLNWRQEGYPGFLTTQLSLINSTIMGTDAPGFTPELHAVEFTDGSSQIINDTFRVTDEYASTTSNFFYDSSGGILALDHVNFACGNETNCINIPIGTYLPTGQTAYESNVTYSSDAGNPTPTVNVSGANYVHTIANAGAITMPTSAVAAGGCDSGTSVTNPNVTPKSTILLSSPNWFGLMAVANAGGGNLTLYLCNWTANSITPGAGTMYYRVVK